MQIDKRQFRRNATSLFRHGKAGVIRRFDDPEWRFVATESAIMAGSNRIVI